MSIVLNIVVGIVLALTVMEVGAAETLLEDPATNVVANVFSSHTATNPALPTEIIWTYGRNDGVGIGGDLFVGRDGRVFRQVPVLNAVTSDGRQGWTEVYTGQKVKIVMSRQKIGQMIKAGALLAVGIFILALGLRAWLSPEWAWNQRQSEAAAEGLEVKRTPEWEASNFKRTAMVMVAGLILLVTGLFMLLSSWSR